MLIMWDWIYTHVPPWVPIAFVVHLAVLGTVAYLILAERKIASWVQDRIGPNRVGPWGLLQPIADGLKFILKEDYRPAGVDKVLFTIAPCLMIVVVIVSIAVIPVGRNQARGRTRSPPARRPNRVIPWGANIVNVTGNQVTYQWPFQIASLNIGVCSCWRCCRCRFTAWSSAVGHPTTNTRSSARFAQPPT
jgi:hypothetical protein